MQEVLQLPKNDVGQDLKTQYNEGKEIVGMLSVNIAIGGTCES